MRQPPEHVNLVGKRDHARVDSPGERKRRQQAGKRKHQSEQKPGDHRPQPRARLAEQNPRQHGRHHGPAADEHVKRGCRSQERPDAVHQAARQGLQPQEGQYVGESLGLDAADDPLARHVAMLHQADKQGRRPYRSPAARDNRPAEPLPRPGQQSPGDQPARPDGDHRRQHDRQPAERKVKNRVRVGGVEKRVIGNPTGIPIVDRLADIVGLVDLGNRPGPLEKEHQEDQRHFGGCLQNAGPAGGGVAEKGRIRQGPVTNVQQSTSLPNRASFPSSSLGTVPVRFPSRSLGTRGTHGPWPVACNLAPVTHILHRTGHFSSAAIALKSSFSE